MEGYADQKANVRLGGKVSTSWSLLELTAMTSAHFSFAGEPY